jgi:hypothetical protein
MIEEAQNIAWVVGIVAFAMILIAVLWKEE